MYGEPAKCRKCGKVIDFLRTKNGKMMPVDSFSLHVIPRADGSIFFLPDGNTIRGREVDRKGPNTIKAYRSHFVTCPYADEVRKPKEGQREAERQKIRERIERERAEAEEKRLAHEKRQKEAEELREAMAAQVSFFGAS